MLIVKRKYSLQKLAFKLVFFIRLIKFPSKPSQNFKNTEYQNSENILS